MNVRVITSLTFVISVLFDISDQRIRSACGEKLFLSLRFTLPSDQVLPVKDKIQHVTEATHVKKCETCCGEQCMVGLPSTVHLYFFVQHTSPV